jgi:U2 small nuclear ribonucleoprotein A'
MKIENFPEMPRLKTLLLSNNRIMKIAPLIGKQLPHLESLILTNNQLAKVDDILPLKDIPSITHLCLLKNPVMHDVTNIRPLVAAILPHLVVLDGARISATERKAADLLALKLKQGQSFASLAVVNVRTGLQPIAPAAAVAGLSAEQKQRLVALIDEATSLEQIEKLEQILVAGVLPEGFSL